MAAGSAAESMLYVSNMKQSTQKVASNIVDRLKFYYASFKSIVSDTLFKSWKTGAQSYGKLQLSGQGEVLRDVSSSLTRSIINDDGAKASSQLKKMAAYLSPPDQRMGSLFQSIGIWGT